MNYYLLLVLTILVIFINSVAATYATLAAGGQPYGPGNSQNYFRNVVCGTRSGGTNNHCKGF